MTLDLLLPWFVAVFTSVGWILEWRRRKRMLTLHAEVESFRRTTSVAVEVHASLTCHSHIARMEALRSTLECLHYTLRSTTEATKKASRCGWNENEGEDRKVETDGALELTTECTTLQKVVGALLRDLYENRLKDLDTECYQDWVASLQDRRTSWQKRQARLHLENLCGRVNELEKALLVAHGVKERSFALAVVPIESHSLLGAISEVESHQDLFDVATALRTVLELKLASKTTGLVQNADLFTYEVEMLERKHKHLDGYLTHLYGVTRIRLRVEALHGWNMVSDYVYGSSAPCSLGGYYEESLSRCREERMRAVKIMVEKGECGQCEAVEHLCVSMRHWGFLRALRVGLSMGQDIPFVEEFDQFQFDLEQIVVQALQDLNQVMNHPAFTDESANPMKLFS